jgi:hypothetical protein
VDEFEDSRGLYSGPTVVDDQKVAEVLKKLRALDQGPGGSGGVAQPVVDSNATAPVTIDPGAILIDSGPAAGAAPAQALAHVPAPVLAPRGGPPPGAPPPGKQGPPPSDKGAPPQVKGAPPQVIKSDPGPARIEDIMYPLQRPTAIGRSASTPADAQPVTIPADAGRGTTFGRSIHLPDANAPDEAEVEISSGAVHYLDGSPPTSQPYPLADGAVAPTPPVAKPALAAPFAAAPGVRLPAAPAQRFHTPYEPTDTQLLRSRSKSTRMLALMVGIGFAGGGWFVWKQFMPPDEPPPAVAAPAPTPPAIIPLPPTSGSAAAAVPAPANAAPEPAAPSEPAAAAQPVAAREPAATPQPVVAREPAAAQEPAAAAATPTAAPPAKPPSARAEPSRAPSRAQTRRRSTSRAERSPAAQVVEPAEDAAPPAPKPSRSRRHAAIGEDPDATLPPSSTDD